MLGNLRARTPMSFEEGRSVLAGGGAWGTGPWVNGSLSGRRAHRSSFAATKGALFDWAKRKGGRLTLLHSQDWLPYSHNIGAADVCATRFATSAP
jgi:hypothetical protein